MKQKVMFGSADVPAIHSGKFSRGSRAILLGLALLFLLFQPALAQDAAQQLEQMMPPEMAQDAASSGAPASDGSSPPTLSDLLGAAESVNDTTTMDLTGTSVPPPLPTQEEQAASERKQAFEGAAASMMPLKPSEIRRLLELYDGTTQAVETPIYPNPEPESSFVQASLEPGAKPVVVKTAVGNVTTISIVDVTGQPWPIQDMTWAGDFQVEQPDAGSHMIRISPQSHFAQGNVSMRLVGLNPPVILSLRTERKSVHVRLDIQIPEVGPKGVLPPVVTPVSIKAGDDEITKVLLGITSQADLTKVAVEGVDGRTSAYQKGDTIYIRTPYTLLSPAWNKSVQSADGMHVYSLGNTPVLLLSDKGKMLKVYLSSMEQSNGE